MTRFIFTEAYEKSLSAIEDYIYQSAENFTAVENFIAEHDRILTFIEHNPQTPAAHPVTGDQSWVFGDGRYRLFFKVVFESPGNITQIFLTHIIDNRQANLEVYPGNRLPTYSTDD